MARVCQCGCGTEVGPKARYALGHHWRVTRDEMGVTDSKVCERCAATYTRDDLAHRQSNKHWLERRYCSRACQEAALAEFNRARPAERHPSWKGDDVTPQAGRKRARQQYADRQPCAVCGSGKSERHHVDGDPRNNSPENVQWLCRKHHFEAEDRMAHRRVENMTPEQQAVRLERRREQARERTRRYKRRKLATMTPDELAAFRAAEREYHRAYRARKRAQQ